MIFEVYLQTQFVHLFKLTNKMPLRLRSDSPNYRKFLHAFKEDRSTPSVYVTALVAKISQMVAKYGDKAIIAYNRMFDKSKSNLLCFNPKSIAIHLTDEEERLLIQLKVSYDRILSYHLNQMPSSSFYTDERGVCLGQKWTPIKSVGVYLPGGTANYLSSMLMNCIPAQIAGVKYIYLATPNVELINQPLFIACAIMCGVKLIYPFGGAQAIAAMSLGTRSVRKVDKIVGPGNTFVTAAKRLASKTTGTDCIAGPSESIVMADRTNSHWATAMDVVSQLEHDKNALSVLITRSFSLNSLIRTKIKALCKLLPRRDVIAHGWSSNGISIVCASTASALATINFISSEHVHISSMNPFNIANRVINAGAIFVGPNTSIALGDYISGTNHVLPTSAAVRFSSGLNVLDFMKKSSFVWAKRSLTYLTPFCATAALLEGMHAHALSLIIKLSSFW
ncbi:MAG: histidinol dehydrogenase [Candidatus Hodgkinia cicadicola]